MVGGGGVKLLGYRVKISHRGTQGSMVENGGKNGGNSAAGEVAILVFRWWSFGYRLVGWGN